MQNKIKFYHCILGCNIFLITCVIVVGRLPFYSIKILDKAKFIRNPFSSAFYVIYMYSTNQT